MLIVAGFAAGVLNAVAGGGTFLSLPALIYAGVPPVAANATATLVALPGYISSAWAYRHDLRAEGTMSLRAIVLISILGALVGAGLLLVTSDAVFSGLIPWLLLLATALFAAGPSIIAASRKQGMATGGVGLSTVVVVAVSTYGGYFNGGLRLARLQRFAQYERAEEYDFCPVVGDLIRHLHRRWPDRLAGRTPHGGGNGSRRIHWRPLQPQDPQHGPSAAIYHCGRCRDDVAVLHFIDITYLSL